MTHDTRPDGRMTSQHCHIFGYSYTMTRERA